MFTVRGCPGVSCTRHGTGKHPSRQPQAVRIPRPPAGPADRDRALRRRAQPAVPVRALPARRRRQRHDADAAVHAVPGAADPDQSGIDLQAGQPRLPGPVRAHRSRLRAGRRAPLRPGPRRSRVLRAPAPLHRPGGRAGRGGRGGAAQQHLRRPGVAAEPPARPEQRQRAAGLPGPRVPEHPPPGPVRAPARARAPHRRGDPPLRQRHLRDLQRTRRPRVGRRGPDGG